jgi:hypothetical protein
MSSDVCLRSQEIQRPRLRSLAGDTIKVSGQRAAYSDGDCLPAASRKVDGAPKGQGPQFL